jgi:hypothetical protein
MRATQTTSRRRRLSPKLNTVIHPIKKVAIGIGARSARFRLYDFLEATYRVYVDWKRSKAANRSARALVSQLALVQRKGTSPIRVLIEATLPNADLKQKSRWVRALEYVHSEDVPPSQFRRFLGNHGGLTGCAHLAVQAGRKRRRPGGDWND